LGLLLVQGDALDYCFSYDPVYRLLSATGRETDVPLERPPWEDQPRSTDITRARGYTETYAYDKAHNLLELRHSNGPDGFTRAFIMGPANNRLIALTASGSTYGYEADGNGNMTSETTSRHFDWGHGDQLIAFRTQSNGAEPSVYAQYLYAASGQRVKKLVRKQGGKIEVTHYIDGAFEHRHWGDVTLSGQNNGVHVIDDKQRVALIRFGTAHPQDTGPATQFYLADHHGSCSAVIDEGGTLTNREEFTPYGETVFGSFARKRYRFTGAERDEESGLSFHVARYYRPGAARWASCDPLGIVGEDAPAYAIEDPIHGKSQPRQQLPGHDTAREASLAAASPRINLYQYARQNPVLFRDLNGRIEFDIDSGSWISEKGDTFASIAEELGVPERIVSALNENVRPHGGNGELDPGIRLGVPPLVRIRAFEAAAKSLFSTAWASEKAKNPLGEGKNKCSLFVSDMYAAVYVTYPHQYHTVWMGTFPISTPSSLPALSEEMADTSKKDIQGFELIDAASARIGDVVAVKISGYNDASGHTLMFAGNVTLIYHGKDYNVLNKSETEKGPQFIGVSTAVGKVLERSTDFLNKPEQEGKYKNLVYRHFAGDVMERR
jgi:RHS repeat-associated protein